MRGDRTPVGSKARPLDQCTPSFVHPGIKSRILSSKAMQKLKDDLSRVEDRASELSKMLERPVKPQPEPAPAPQVQFVGRQSIFELVAIGNSGKKWH